MTIRGFARDSFLVVGLALTGRTLAAQQSPGTQARPEITISAIAKAANGAVVSIIMSDKDGEPVAEGTGFIISRDGGILTNYHVISEGTSAIVKLPDGAFYIVDGVLASDKVRDVAIIKAHGANFRTLTLGNSDNIEVGEEVVAIGNPLSLESTVSNGIISAIRIAETQGGRFIQITAPISHGSSGGPLFNKVGEVIGITAMGLEGGANLNFAIPINDAKRLLLSPLGKIHALPNEPEPVQAETRNENTTNGFHLRTECAGLAAKLEKANSSNSVIADSWSSNYNVKYDRCFVLNSYYRPVGKTMEYVLFDGETGDILAWATDFGKTQGGVIYKSPNVPYKPTCTGDSDCSYKFVQQYIDERMTRNTQ